MTQQERPGSPIDPVASIDELHIETPVIDIQDLEHKPGPQTRVSNKGVKIEPTLDSAQQRNFTRDDEAVLDALEELEKSIRHQAPG